MSTPRVAMLAGTIPYIFKRINLYSEFIVM